MSFEQLTEMEEEELKIGKGSTAYIIRKMCRNCLEINPKDQKRCLQCDYLFVREANPDETTITASFIDDLKTSKEAKKKNG